MTGTHILDMGPILINIVRKGVFSGDIFNNTVITVGQVFASLPEHLHYKIPSDEEVWKK